MKDKVALISPEKSAYSATFIQAHIDLLNADIKHLYGIFFPVQSADNRYVLKENEFLKKAFAKLRLKRTYKRFFKNPQLTKCLKDENIQLVFAEFGSVGAEVCSVCRSLNLPLIVHFHGYDAYAHSILSQYGKLYQEVFDYASFLIVVSQDMKNQLLHLGAPEHKLVLNPCGPNDAFFGVSPTFETKNFVAVGRFVEKKAPHLVISAFEKVCKKIPDVKLLMAGDGPLLVECQELTKSLNIEKSVVFLGRTTPKEVVDLFSNAYCFVQHSVVASNGDSEGTPVAILEAGAAGLPIVATRHAGIQDVILHEETGFLIDEHNVDGMAEAMLKLAKDKSMAQKMGVQGKTRMQKHYTMKHHIDLLNNLIQQALAKR